MSSPQQNPPKIVYDLTEVMHAFTGRFRYYGIARVVGAVAAELKRTDPRIRYAVFSFGEGAFYEVVPSVRPDGTIDLGIPEGVRQFRVRYRPCGSARTIGWLSAPIRWGQRLVNRIYWRLSASPLVRLDIDGAVLVSTSRPKLIAEVLAALDRKQVRYRSVPLIYDLIMLHDKVGGRRSARSAGFLADMSFIVSRSEKLLAISDFTKSELQAFSASGVLPPVPAITTVPLVHECTRGTEAPDCDIPDSAYLLTVGSTLGRKNLGVLFDAMALLHRTGRAVPKLVLAGAVRKRVLDRLNDPAYEGIRDLVEVRPDPNQTDLVRLYEGALALVVPSRMEGWGLPAGEALWCGTPAICSTAPALREVCGDLGLYFDPDSPAELAEWITKLLEDDAFRTDLRARIRDARPRLRSWRNVAVELSAALPD